MRMVCGDAGEERATEVTDTPKDGRVAGAASMHRDGTRKLVPEQDSLGTKRDVLSQY
jgi:hypothetical protein